MTPTPESDHPADPLVSSSPLQTRRDALRQGAAVVAGLGLAGALHPASAAEPSPAPATDKPGRLKGKVAVVTGAARGIGRAIAVAFAREGADVMGLDIAGPASTITAYPAATVDELEETGRMVDSTGRRFISYKADIRDLDALKKAADLVKEKFDRLDIIVANAGIQTFKPFMEMDEKHWHDVINVNLNGTANTVRAFTPLLIAGKEGGRIIITSSTQGRHGSKNASSYACSKWALYGLTKTLALELGEHKITVNALVPGLIDTPMTHNPTRWTEALKEDGKQPSQEPPTEEEVAKAQLPHMPLKVPWLPPEAMAPAAVFLASDDAALVSGSSYDVTAGDSAHFI